MATVEERQAIQRALDERGLVGANVPPPEFKPFDKIPRLRRNVVVTEKIDGTNAIVHVCVSIHMPRWASRITLEVTAVRVERLQAITEDDARAEGVTPFLRDIEGGDCWSDGTARSAFHYLWGQINGFDSWEANPHVWVVSFARVP